MARRILGLVDSTPAVLKAVDMVLAGQVKRVDVSDSIKVYECAGVVRVDYKFQEVEEA